MTTPHCYTDAFCLNTVPHAEGDPASVPRLKAMLAPILLRRTKDTLDENGQAIVTLPPRIVEVVRYKQL
jgi:SNF2 family DNA or RNA helicase